MSQSVFEMQLVLEKWEWAKNIFLQPAEQSKMSERQLEWKGETIYDTSEAVREKGGQREVEIRSACGEQRIEWEVSGGEGESKLDRLD